MKKFHLFELAGDFGEDKDAAASLRKTELVPSLKKGENIELDFEYVILVTQSFVHALISDILRTFGEDVLDRIEFINCTGSVKGIVGTVVQYSLDSMDDA